MSDSAAKGVFLVNMTILAIIVVLAVYQVPQPWRGYVVAWLLFMATAGLFALRVIRHHYAFKSLELQERGPSAPRRDERGERRRERPTGLRVVRSATVGNGRTVLR